MSGGGPRVSASAVVAAVSRGGGDTSAAVRDADAAGRPSEDTEFFAETLWYESGWKLYYMEPSTDVSGNGVLL